MPNKHRSKSLISKSSGKDFVLNKAHENNVRFIRLWFTDILGQLKSFAITIDELEEVMTQGAGFDGSAIEGFARTNESEMRAMPDASTFEILPWRPREDAVARMFANIVDIHGNPFVGDPRNCLKRHLKKASDMGYIFYVGPEMEYFYFQNGDATKVLDQGGYFDLTSLDAGSDLRRETVLTLEQMGIGVETSYHEAAPSQHEIDLRYTDALTMADNAMTCRLVVKEVAMKNGVYATFMPKPLKGENGSGMHVHQSLFSGDKNAFYDAHDKDHLSKVAKHYIAGILKRSREISLVASQWVNSYKRLTPGFEAPVNVIWARRNPLAMLRVPTVKAGRQSAVRVELRSPDAACNPYLLFSVMLAAGLEGIKNKYELPAACEGSAHGTDTLPQSLGEAIAIAENSKFLKDALGEHIYHSLIENKKIEWNKYCAEITDYELRKYLPIL